MNKQILATAWLLIFIIFSVNTHAQVQRADSTFVAKDYAAINDEVVSEQTLRDLCATAREEILKDTTDYNVFKRVLEVKVGISSSDPSYKEKMTQFWQDNMDRFVCPEYSVNGQTYPKQHIFKRLMHENYPDFYYDYLFAEDLVEIDFNYVEVVNGKKETVVDYLDKLLTEKKDDPTYDLDEIKDIRDGLLEEFGAKRAKDL